MHVFIDESGSFSGFGPRDSHSLAAVGALCIPDSRLPKLQKKYSSLRTKLPQERGEVKGKALSEKEVAEVVDLLRRNEVILEISVTDVASHSETGVLAYRDELAEYMQGRMDRFNAEAQKKVALAVQQIRQTSPQLLLQAIVTMDVLERVFTARVPLLRAAATKRTCVVQMGGRQQGEV